MGARLADTTSCDFSPDSGGDGVPAGLLVRPFGGHAALARLGRPGPGHRRRGPCRHAGRRRALYASGNLKIFEKEVRSRNSFMKDVLFKLDPVFPKLSIMNGNEVIRIFKEITDINSFEELSIPLTTVATDIVNNVKIESNKGDLINAIKASIAIPGVLTPTYVNDNLCVDGGLIDPVPLQSIIDMGSDRTIAVNLYGLQTSKKKDNKYNIVDIVDRSAKIILNNVTHLSFKNNEPNILIEPPIDQFYGWDFHRANELIDIGYDTAKSILRKNEKIYT